MSASDKQLPIYSVTRENSPSMFRRRRTLILLLALVATAYYMLQPRSQRLSLFGSSAPACEKGAPKVHTKNGTYCGVFTGEHSQDLFLGIPYAKPPVADLRFRSPKPLDAPFKGVKRATRYSDFCPGHEIIPAGFAAAEDCLYLNIVRPSLYDGRDPLPVAVWIHGGGFKTGSASEPKYNLSYIVQEGVTIGKPFIGVSINYRISVWGFLAGRDVANSGDTNVGLRDQRLALQWVHENIKAFGGDPAKVTIWGESAGAASVGLHLTAYGGRDDKLFRAAVMESGGPVPYSPMKNVQGYDREYENLLKLANCDKTSDKLECLRQLPYKTLYNLYLARPRPIWMPAIDGDFIQKLPTEQLAAKQFVHVPIIAGANSDEGTSFAPKGMESPEQFESLVESRIKGSLVKKIISAYPDDACFGVPEDIGCKRLEAPYGAQFRRAAAFVGDLTFIGPRRLTCTTWARAGLPAYCYRFNAHAAGIPRELGAPHFAEVAYVFAHPANSSPEHARLAKLMARSWASFFADLNPNAFRGGAGGFVGVAGADAGDGVPQWPAYDDAASMQFVFDAVPGGRGREGGVGGNHVEADTFREEGIRIINSRPDAMGP